MESVLLIHPGLQQQADQLAKPVRPGALSLMPVPGDFEKSFYRKSLPVPALI